MRDDIQFRQNTITESQLYQHFCECQTSLNGIDISNHVAKLIKYSTSFEAWNGDILAGICNCYLNNYDSKIAFISHIEVNKEYKRQGLGRNLIITVISTARSMNFNKLQLEVHKENIAALAFYNSMGFTIIQDRISKYLMNLNIE